MFNESGSEVNGVKADRLGTVVTPDNPRSITATYRSSDWRDWSVLSFLEIEDTEQPQLPIVWPQTTEHAGL